MIGAEYDLKIKQGSTFRRILTLKNDDDSLIDLTYHEARMQIRKTPRAAGDPLIGLTSFPPAGITMGGAAGTIEIVITDEQTALFEFGRGYYDLELVNGEGEVSTLIYGRVEVVPEVTR